MKEQAERSPTVAISNAIVQIYKEAYGKGATRARTRMMDDVIVVELEDVLTRVEHTLIAAGREDQIRETRQVFEQANREAFVRAVEEITARKVRAFLSQIHFTPDLAVQVFLLEHQVNGA
ncbi:MAG: Na-translocating system protein MpsC family protein [Thermoleophilaceae bacterium]